MAKAPNKDGLMSEKITYRELVDGVPTLSSVGG